MSRPRQMTRELAESVAIQALSFIAAEPRRLDVFLSLTGLTPQSLRAAAAEPNFLLGVLDHVTSSEDLLRAFAEEIGSEPETVPAARDLLAGAPPTTG
jgi:hypothetical protein